MTSKPPQTTVLGCPPSVTLQDILRPDITTSLIKTRDTSLHDPSLILGDWLYLGNRFQAHSLQRLQKLGITHILNITLDIANLYPDFIKYAQIQIGDVSQFRLYEYFEAAALFIDECNPFIQQSRIHNRQTEEKSYSESVKIFDNDIKEMKTEVNESKKNRILVHCAMGISRSASIVIAYLISRTYFMDEMSDELQILNNIQNELQSFRVTGVHWPMSSFQKKQAIKEWKQRRSKIAIGTVDIDMRDICNGMTLGEAFHFVLHRRPIICPNLGFCRQLAEYEQFIWKTTESTIYQIPCFNPNFQQESKSCCCDIL